MKKQVERHGADERCNCMVLFDPVLPPGEHTGNCPLRRGTLQFRATSDERSVAWWDAPENDGLWDDDREEAEEMAEVLRGLGSANVRIERRIHITPDPEPASKAR